jgi:hypothetical protein
MLGALQQMQLPAQGMVKGCAIALKEVMEVDPMPTMLTEDQHLFHRSFSASVHHSASLTRPQQPLLAMQESISIYYCIIMYKYSLLFSYMLLTPTGRWLDGRRSGHLCAGHARLLYHRCLP